MYNHHQTGPGGSVMFAPPFRDPFNYNFHPMIAGRRRTSSARSCTRGSSRKASRAWCRAQGASYSTWWNGGLRTTAYFHNQIGILTETIGNPTPGRRFRSARRVHVRDGEQLVRRSRRSTWQFRQSIDYSITANRAVLDFASRYRETNLYRIYQMGKDEIQWGNEDHWTITPHTAREGRAAATAALPRRRRRRRRRGGAPGAGGVAAAAVADGAAAAAACGNALYAALHDAGESRSARLHHAVRRAGLRLGRALRQRADQVRHHGASRDRAVHRGRQAVPGELAHREDARRRSVRT